MRTAIVLLYAILTLNIVAGVAGAVVLPDGRPAVRATGGAIRPRPAQDETVVIERLLADVLP